MKKYLVIVLTLAAMLMLFSAVAQAAAPAACTSGNYVYSNDDNYLGSNSVSAFCDTGSGAPAYIGTYATGGNGQGGGYFGADRLNTLAVAGKAIFANDAGTADIAIMKIGAGGTLSLLGNYSTGHFGDASIVGFYAPGKSAPCLVAGFANDGVLNSYKISGTSPYLTLVSSVSSGIVDGIAIQKPGDIAWANLGGYGYTTINAKTCALGSVGFVGGFGGEAGVSFSADGKMVYLGVDNGSTPTMSYGPYKGTLSSFTAFGSGGSNASTVIVNKTGTCAVFGDSYTPGVTTVTMAGGVPTAFSNDSFDSLGGFYTGMVAWRADESEVFHMDTSGSTNYLVAHGITGCTAGAAAGTNTTVSGPYSMSVTTVPLHVPWP